MSPQHQDLAAGRWDTLTLVEKLGNIGSEVERALRWQDKGNREYAIRAMDRALELFALTLACPGNKDRLSEVARAREVCLDYFFGENTFKSTGKSLRRYYLPFGVAARIAHDNRKK